MTSSPLSLKRNPSSVSACSGSSGQGPASPLRRAVSSVSERSAASGVSSLGSAEAGQRRMVAASPCTCGQQPPQPLQGHENYDIPRNLGRQVSIGCEIVCSVFSFLSYCLQKIQITILRASCLSLETQCQKIKDLKDPSMFFWFRASL